MKTHEEKMQEIAARHANEWCREKGSVVEVITNAMIEALDTIDSAELATQLKRAERDSSAWMDKYLRELEAHRLAKSEVLTLARWKEEALTVESWWKEIDTFIRKHPDAMLGSMVSDNALKWLRERDTLKAELRALDGALNMDIHPGKDREGVARHYHHENVDLRFAGEGLQNKVFELTNTRAAMFEAMRLLAVDLAEMTKARDALLASTAPGEK